MEALVFVEVEDRVEANIDLDEAGAGLDADVGGAGAVAVVVRTGAYAVRVLEEENLLALGGREEDVVFRCDGVVVVFYTGGCGVLATMCAVWCKDYLRAMIARCYTQSPIISSNLQIRSFDTRRIAG